MKTLAEKAFYKTGQMAEKSKNKQWAELVESTLSWLEAEGYSSLSVNNSKKLITATSPQGERVKVDVRPCVWDKNFKELRLDYRRMKRVEGTLLYTYGGRFGWTIKQLQYLVLGYDRP